MRICVVGGDARFARLRLALREYGKARGAAYIFGEEKALDAWETPLQPEDLAMIFSAKERVIGGKSAVALLREESFLRENACLTAEGALVAAASRAPFALLGSVCLVVGYGRIGAALVDRLVGLGAKPVVYSRRAEGRLRAMARGAQAVESLPQALAQANFVFSTPPDLLLTKDVLQYARKEARDCGPRFRAVRRRFGGGAKRWAWKLGAKAACRAAIAQIARRKRWNGR